MEPVVVLTGAGSALGRRVRDLLDGEAGEGRSVVTQDPDRADAGLLDTDLKRGMEHAQAVLHLDVGIPSTPTAATGDVDVVRRVLDAAAAASVEQVVLLSDASVYGAWSNNPQPLTENAVLRPNPGFTYAAERAEIERLAAEWRGAHPGARVAVLRVARTPGHNDWLIRALRPAPAVPEHADEPPVQFLDLDDLAAAVLVALGQGLDGAYNVAPDGAIRGDEVRSLTGTGPRVRLPDRLADRVAKLRFRSGLGPTPPELMPYTLHPWVVANDRLRAEGWAPQVTNEEACIASHEVGPWATMSPRRRQEIALGVAGTAVVGALAGGAIALRRWLRR